MSESGTEEAIKTLDVRLTWVEQKVETLVTREEMHAAIRAEGDAARRHATVLYEDLRDDNRIIFEHLLRRSDRVDALAHHARPE